MATTAKAYGLFLKSALNKEIDFDTDTVKVMLTTSAYTPDQDTHQYKSSVTGEVSGTNYTTGGVTLSGKAVTYTASTNVLKLDATTDPAFSNVTIAAFRYAVFYVDTGSSATSPLISYMDFGTDQSATAQTVTIVLPSTGLIQLTVA